MGRNGIVIGTIIAIILIAGGAYALVSRSSDSNDTETTDTTTQTTTATPTPGTTTASPTPTGSGGEGAESSAGSTITYAASGFAPSSVTVKAGTTVTVKNDSSAPLQFASDPHPEHTDNPDLNAGGINPGESKTFTTSKTGTWGFHNHLNATDTGKLIVQ